MGIVSEYVRQLIAKQVHDHQLVVWFDPEQHYTEFASTLIIPDTTVARYSGSFFQLRHDISALLEGEQPPRLVVYVPLASDATDDALVELTAPGVVLQPGQQSRQRNTRLSVLAKAALKDALGADQIRTVEKQVESGQLTLADLDHMGERAGGSAASGVVTVIFQTGNPETIALGVLGSPAYDAAIEERRARADVARLLSQAYAVELPATEFLNDLRVRLTRHVLCTELLATLEPPLPTRLTTVKRATEPAARDACIALARRWRQDRALTESYAASANRVEQELGLSAMSFTRVQVQHVETFAATDAAAQAAIEEELRTNPSADVLHLVAQRQHGYWAEQVPEVRARWALAGIAGRLLLQAQEIDMALRSEELSAEHLVRRYTEGERPWCELDAAQREMEQHSHRFDFGPRHATLVDLLTTVRRRYLAVASNLAERFTHAFEQAGFQLSGIPHQRATFATHVAPSVRAGKTAYVLVDALRFEMARALAATLQDDAEVDLTAAIGTVPTITEIGMAALQPGAEGAMRIVPAGAGKLAVELDSTPLRDRKSRIEWFHSQVGLGPTGRSASVYDMTLSDLMSPRPDLDAKLKKADLILVTSQEIDAIGEMDNSMMARTVMDTLLANLSRGLRKLSDLGCHKIIVVADHGYLFGEALDTDMKIDPPGGQQLDLHRRVWVGRGGAANAAYLRAPLSAFGVSADDAELATPWGFGVFRVAGGATAYFHGGLSLPELVIPVLTLVPHAVTRSARGMQSSGEIEWTLVPGSKKISTRFFTVQVAGHHGGLFDVTLAPVRVELHRNGETISLPVAATYGFQEATGDVLMAFAEDADTRLLAPNSITLMVTRDDLPAGKVSVHLLNSATGVELQRLDAIDMAISL